MKLTKISLATIVALGALSSSAVATPLEEAIKNVDLSGFARYRYEHTKTTQREAKNKQTLENDGAHGFKSLLNLKATYDDNFYGALGLRYTSSDGSGGKDDTTDIANSFNVKEFYLGYKAGNTTITAGKQIIGSFFTDDVAGTGIRVSNSDITGLTLTALAFDAIDKGSELNAFKTYNYDTDPSRGISAKKNLYANGYGNLYGLAAIGSYDPISFQVWFADLTKIVRLAALEVSGNFNIGDDVSIGVKGQFVNSHANKEIREAAEANLGNGNFYALEFSSELFGADLTAGYIGHKAQKGKYAAFTIDDQASLINAGEQTSDTLANNYTYSLGKTDLFFVGAGYHVTNNIYAGLDVVYGTNKVKVAEDATVKSTVYEFVPRASYAYSKKLKFSTFYSYLKYKAGDSSRIKSDKIRFEAKYSF